MEGPFIVSKDGEMRLLGDDPASAPIMIAADVYRRDRHQELVSAIGQIPMCQIHAMLAITRVAADPRYLTTIAEIESALWYLRQWHPELHLPEPERKQP
jgi:hypothetical protein